MPRRITLPSAFVIPPVVVPTRLTCAEGTGCRVAASVTRTVTVLTSCARADCARNAKAIGRTRGATRNFDVVLPIAKPSSGRWHGRHDRPADDPQPTRSAGGGGTTQVSALLTAAIRRCGEVSAD